MLPTILFSKLDKFWSKIAKIEYLVDQIWLLRENLTITQKLEIFWNVFECIVGNTDDIPQGDIWLVLVELGGV